MVYRTLISLVSAQTLPNVLFIKAFTSFDKYIFVSTDEMERRGKTFAIIKATGINSTKCQVINTTYDDYAKVISDLQGIKVGYQKEDETIVNVTGGTKLMAMAVSKFFWGQTSTKIYYLPLNAKYLQEIFPVLQKIEFPNPPEINLKEYFASHGFEIDGQTKLTYPWIKTQALYNRVLDVGNAGMVNELSKAYNTNYFQSDKIYLTGGWFEQYIYGAIKRELNLSDSMIVFNLKMKEFDSPQPTESDNEIDIAFIIDNKLYLGECKIYLSKMRKAIPMHKIQDPMFKIASVRNNFGLSANCFVAFGTLIGNHGPRKERLDQLKRLLKIHDILDLNSFHNKRNLKEILNL